MRLQAAIRGNRHRIAAGTMVGRTLKEGLVDRLPQMVHARRSNILNLRLPDDAGNASSVRILLIIC